MGKEFYDSRDERPADALGAASAFAGGLADAFRAPAVGARQLFGDESAAKDFFKAQQENTDGLGAGAFRSAGSLLGTAALYSGVNLVVRSLAPAPVARFTPLITGAAVGFFRPLQEDAGGGTRLLNAGVGAGTMLLMDKGEGMYLRMNLAGKLFASRSSLMLQAGALNTQAESLIEHGRMASFRDTVLGGTSWLATGMAAKALVSEGNVQAYWRARPVIDNSKIGPAYTAELNKLQVPPGARVVPSFDATTRGVELKPKPLVLDEGHSTVQLFDANTPSIVRIRTNRGGSGSGFFVDEAGYIGTAAHVVQTKNGAPLHLKADLADGRSLRAKIVDIDAVRDVALLKVQGKGFRPMPLSVEKPPVDTPVFVLGHPEGARRMFITQGQVTPPEVIQPGAPKSRWSPEYTLNTNAASYPGNSGGPILDAQGKVLAVLTYGNFVMHSAGTHVEHLSKLLPFKKPSA